MYKKGLYYKDKDDEDPDDELLHRHQRNVHLKEVEFHIHKRFQINYNI